MKMKILSSIATLVLLGSSATFAASFTYESNGGFVHGSPIGTNTNFDGNLGYVDPHAPLGGDDVYRGIDWGVASTDAGRSGLRTVPKTGTVVSYPSGTVPIQEPFGDLEHINHPITSDGGSLIYTKLRWHLKVTDANDATQSWEYTWDFDLYNWETSNNADPCPNRWDPPNYEFPNNVVANGVTSHVFTPNLDIDTSDKCHDAHDFAVTTTQEFTWTIGNTVYRVNGSGFYDEEGFLRKTFWAAEDGTSTGSVKFFIEEVGPDTVTVGDRVWVDLNHDGVQNDTPHAVAVIPVKLLGYRSGARDTTLDQTTTTNSLGVYQFRNVSTGHNSTDTLTYEIKFDLPLTVADKFKFSPKDRGADDTKDSDVDENGLTDKFSVTADRTDIDAGIMLGAIGNYVWDDIDKDGIQDSNENGLANITVNLYKDGSNASPYETRTTGVNGEYLFEPLGEGTYHLKFILPNGYEFSPKNTGSDTTIDSDADTITGETVDIQILFDPDYSDAHTLDWDAGMSLIPVTHPSLLLEKTSNGLDADTAPGRFVHVGGTVRWDYEITNNGDVILDTITLTDNKLGTIACPKDTLNINETMTCTTTGIAIAGQYENNGTVTGKSNAGTTLGDTVSASDLSHYFGEDASISMNKFTNGVDVAAAPGPYIPVGSAVNWTYNVTNTGNADLINISVIDNDGVSVSCPQANLAIGASMTCAANGQARAGQYENLAIATGLTSFEVSVNDRDTSYYFGENASLTMEKSTNGDDADAAPGPYIPVGNPLTWEYNVTNTGNVNLINVNVSDDQGVTVTCPDTNLAVAATMTCTASGNAVAGQYKNEGIVTGTASSGADTTDSDLSHYFGEDTSRFSIEKSTNGSDSDTAPGLNITIGDPILWIYRVYNGSNVALTDVNVTDDIEGQIICPKDTLAIDEHMDCNATGVAREFAYENNATVTATTPQSGTITDWDLSHYTGVQPVTHPSLSIEKNTNGLSSSLPSGAYIPVGTSIEWNYVIKNTGDVDLSDLTVVDDQGVTVTCPDIKILAVGATMICTASGTAVADQYTNEGNVTGTSTFGTTNGQQVSAVDLSHYFGENASLTIEKSTNGEDADTGTEPSITAGDPIIWTYHITNTGNVNFTNINVVDDQGVEVTCLQKILAIGQSMTCTAQGEAILGQYTNIGTVTANSPSGADTSASDTSSYIGIASDTGDDTAENCPCNDVKSDSSSTFGTVSATLMMLMTLMAGLFFVRREELLNRNER